MEWFDWLRHPLWSIVAVLAIGIVAGLVGARAGSVRRRLGGRGAFVVATAVCVGVAGAFVGFHLAMLSNVALGMVLYPFMASAGVAALLLLGWVGLGSRR